MLAAASCPECPADVTQRSVLTADELAGTPSDAEDGPDGREATCRRLGIEGVPPPEQRQLILEGYFLPIEHPLDDVAREINRELGYLSMLEARDAAGLTPAEAVAAGGAALDRVLARIDDCEWRVRRAEAEGRDTSMLPDPDELGGASGYPRARAGDAIAGRPSHVSIFASPPLERFCCALMLALLDGHSRQAKAADGTLVATLFNPANAALAQMTAAIPSRPVLGALQAVGVTLGGWPPRQPEA